MAERRKVTDPAVLQQLNGGSAAPAERKRVTDPGLLHYLNGNPEEQAARQLRKVPNQEVDPATNQPPGVPVYQPPGVAGYDPKTGQVAASDRTGALDTAGAFAAGAVDGVPIVGPSLLKASQGVAAAAAAPFSDQSVGQIYDEMGRDIAEVQEANPTATLTGNVVGAVAPILATGTTQLGARVLGMSGGSLLGRTAASGLSSAAIASGDAAARGSNLGDTAESGAWGGAIGAAIPGVGAGLGAVGRAVKDTVGPRLNALVRPAREAERRVGAAVNADAPSGVLTAADEAAAKINGQSLLNVDRGGETTRALARSAANTDPEARALLTKTASDRFASQGERAQSFIQRITGGATDDLALQDQLRAASRAANKPAYDKAFSAPAAQQMATPGLMSLLRSPAVREAAKGAETRGANRAVVEGFQTVKNPFVFDEAGNATMRPGVQPTLQFWDQVKRNLDSNIGQAQRSGDKALAADLTALKSKMVNELDQAVPDYAAARQGAAAFFGAEDALDAGRKFVNQNRTIGETRRALGKMSQAERSTFAVGFASELKDAIAQSGDRTNVINKIFGSEQARQKIEMALGKNAYNQFEQFVKIENVSDMLRGALGNSTTARQLIEMGLAGGATGWYTGDIKSGMIAAAVVGLARKGGAKVDAKVTKKVAELLLKDDPKALQQAVLMATTNPTTKAAISSIQNALAAITRGGAISQPGTEPVAR